MVSQLQIQPNSTVLFETTSLVFSFPLKITRGAVLYLCNDVLRRAPIYFTLKHNEIVTPCLEYTATTATHLDFGNILAAKMCTMSQTHVATRYLHLQPKMWECFHCDNSHYGSSSLTSYRLSGYTISKNEHKSV